MTIHEKLTGFEGAQLQRLRKKSPRGKETADSSGLKPLGMTNNEELIGATEVMP
jgi:hypothetical protein